MTRGAERACVPRNAGLASGQWNSRQADKSRPLNREALRAENEPQTRATAEKEQPLKRLYWVVISLIALLSVSMLALPKSAPAQVERFQVTFQNLAAQCVWMTLYRSPASYLSDWEIVKDPGAQPQMVRPYKSITMTIGRPGGIRMRNQIMYTCSGGGGHTTHDTQFTEVLSASTARAVFTLHQNMHKSTYYISGSFP